MSVTRDAAGATVTTADGTAERFDAVVMATHADDALALLRDADLAERNALSAASTTRATRSCSTPTSGSCRRPAGRWASWNVDVADCRRPGGEVTMTYHMNRLQSLPGPEQYFVSLNPGDGDRGRTG